MPSVRHKGTEKGTLCWEGLGKWLEVRGPIVVDLKVLQRYRKESRLESSPSRVQEQAPHFRVRRAGVQIRCGQLRSVTSPYVIIEETAHGRKPADSHLGHLVSYLPLDPIFKHLHLLLHAYVILVM